MRTFALSDDNKHGSCLWNPKLNLYLMSRQNNNEKKEDSKISEPKVLLPCKRGLFILPTDFSFICLDRNKAEIPMCKATRGTAALLFFQRERCDYLRPRLSLPFLTERPPLSWPGFPASHVPRQGEAAAALKLNSKHPHLCHLPPVPPSNCASARFSLEDVSHGTFFEPPD